MSLPPPNERVVNPRFHNHNLLLKPKRPNGEGPPRKLKTLAPKSPTKRGNPGGNAKRGPKKRGEEKKNPWCETPQKEGKISPEEGPKNLSKNLLSGDLQKCRETPGMSLGI